MTTEATEPVAAPEATPIAAETIVVIRVKSKRKEIPVEIEIEDELGMPIIWKGCIREFGGTQRDEWMTGMANKGQFDNADGKKEKNYQGLFAFLISLCLHDKDNKPVPAHVIQKWSCEAQETLFKECQYLNRLIPRPLPPPKEGQTAADVKAEDDAKNE